MKYIDTKYEKINIDLGAKDGEQLSIEDWKTILSNLDEFSSFSFHIVNWEKFGFTKLNQLLKYITGNNFWASISVKPQDINENWIRENICFIDEIILELESSRNIPELARAISLINVGKNKIYKKRCKESKSECVCFSSASISVSTSLSKIPMKDIEKLLKDFEIFNLYLDSEEPEDPDECFLIPFINITHLVNEDFIVIDNDKFLKRNLNGSFVNILSFPMDEVDFEKKLKEVFNDFFNDFDDEDKFIPFFHLYDY